MRPLQVRLEVEWLGPVNDWLDKKDNLHQGRISLTGLRANVGPVRTLNALNIRLSYIGDLRCPR